MLEMRELPPNLFWYDVGGITVFPVVGAVGTYLSMYYAFLMERVPYGTVDFAEEGLHEAGEGRWYTVKLTFYDDEHTIPQKIDQAIKALNG